MNRYQMRKIDGMDAIPSAQVENVCDTYDIRIKQLKDEIARIERNVDYWYDRANQLDLIGAPHKVTAALPNPLYEVFLDDGTKCDAEFTFGTWWIKKDDGMQNECTMTNKVVSWTIKSITGAKHESV